MVSGPLDDSQSIHIINIKLRDYLLWRIRWRMDCCLCFATEQFPDPLFDTADRMVKRQVLPPLVPYFPIAH